MKLIYTAFSKHYFFFRMHISAFVLKKGCVPLNPFMLFEYFLLGAVDRPTVYEANNTVVKRADELWVFGPVSDGVFDEIKIAKQVQKPIRYFAVIDSREIKEISKEEVKFEEDLKDTSSDEL